MAGCSKEATEPPPGAESTVTILVVDDEGSPVTGALLGKIADRIEEEGPEWNFAGALDPNHGGFVPLVTNDKGRAKFDVSLAYGSGVNFYARHRDRRLTGVLSLSKEELESAATEEPPVTLQLVPECRVTGKVVSSDLEKLNRPLKYVDAAAELNGRTVCDLSAAGTEYELFLPPGEFELAVRALDCPRVTRKLVVPPDTSELEVPPIDVQASQLVFLIGKPAPEFTGINEWKNSAPRSLADFRGRYVLLEFWGYWCGPCVYKMPEIVALRDKYSEDELAIIGVHVDYKTEDEVNTVAALDEKLAKTRENLWNGRDLPFPVALAKANKVTNPGQIGQERSAMARLYGVYFYPTSLLIDPDGNVVGEFPGDEAFSKLVESHRHLETPE